MKQVYAADIRPGDQVAGMFRVVEARLAPYRDESKGHYLQLVLADRSGQLEARLWEGVEQVTSWLKPGAVVSVKARALLYQDRIRLRLDAVTAVDEEELPDLADLLPPPGIDVGEALATIHAAVERVAGPELQALLRSLFGDPDLVSAFSMAPPERPGHALERTVGLLEIARPLAHSYPDLDHDLLQAAILVHALGTVATLEGERGRRAVAWLGVPLLSDQVLVERLGSMPDFPPETMLRLRHMLRVSADPTLARTREAAVFAGLLQLQQALETR